LEGPRTRRLAEADQPVALRTALMLTDAQAKNIQGVGIAGFRKDHQQLIAVRIDDAQRARRLVRELAERTANAWEVKRFNELFSEIRSRGREAEESIEATWLATLI